MDLIERMLALGYKYTNAKTTYLKYALDDNLIELEELILQEESEKK